MHTDKENSSATPEQVSDSVDSSQESTLKWLMEELDKDEPTESLFVVERTDDVDLSLSAFEAEIASRPMVRGRAGADDFDSYVGEEIVISSEVGGSDIYSADSSVDEIDEDQDIEESMALDFSLRDGAAEELAHLSVEDGSDILGLEDEDDIGDTFLVVKRVPKEAAPVAPPIPESPDESIVFNELPAEPVPLEPSIAEMPPVAAEQPAEMAAPADMLVTNEQSLPPVEDIVFVEGEESSSEYSAEPNSAENGGAKQSVEAYIASTAAPLDDEEFDDFLMAGSELSIEDEEIDDLTLALHEEDAFLDAGPGEFIDLPEELHAMADEGEDVLSVVTPLIGPLMDELAAALAARLRTMGKPDNAVFSDLSLATDGASQAMAREQDYAPVMEICAVVPECLSTLSAAQLNTIYLRLAWVENGSVCNSLFLEEPVTQDVAAPVDESADAMLPESDFTADELDVPASPEAWSTPEASPPPQVFDEDIFATESFDDELLAESSSSADIDALFDDLGESGTAGDDICGIDVEEFAESGTAPELSEASELVLAEAAPSAAPAAEDDMSWAIPADIHFSHSSPANTDIFAEFLDAFIEEGSSELEKLEDAVARWEADISDADAYSVVTRTLHTIKGIAKGVGLHYYGTLIHNFETLLEGMSRPQAGEEQTYFRIVNAWLDAAVRGVDYIETSRCDIQTEFPSRDSAVAQPLAEIEPEAETVQADEAPAVAAPVAAIEEVAEPAVVKPARDPRRKEMDKKLADEGARALAAQQSVRITSEKLDLLLNLSNQAQQLGVRTAQSAARNKRTSAELQARLGSVRAHISDIADRALFNVTSRAGSSHSSELDALEMDQYSELQEAANILREGVEDLAELIEIASRNNSQAEALLKQQATVISSIGSSIRAARVVPVSRLMPGLRRLVRTVSNDLGKEVAFRVANEVGTLDRDDYARCQTILEHMVRNALDHGIESGTERSAAGKGSVGQITVDVRMSGADSVIVLSDDGRGIDPDAMRESAIRKGLDVDAYSLSDDEALKLIFHKGFSTAETLSQISGRGVGMDIVLSELQQMGGDIQIESKLGQGTSFHIRIPSNVTVNGALLVTAGDASYAIPLGGLIAVEEVPVDDFFAAVETGGMLALSGMECEPAYLGTLCHSGNLPERSTWRRTVPVIVAGSDARHMAIAIDDVEEALELVIRSLGAQFASVPGVAGAATTADGEAIVALDLNVLVACFSAEQGTAVAIDQPEEDRFVALVVDDSRTQRMVATSQLETVGIETATAENGAVAIDWLNTTEQLPDVILLDVEMPVKDGIQTLREIRKSARYSHIPVIMVTSRTGVKHRTLAEEAGCNGYMGKPFNFRMLIGQINELTGHRLQLS